MLDRNKKITHSNITSLFALLSIETDVYALVCVSIRVIEEVLFVRVVARSQALFNSTSICFIRPFLLTLSFQRPFRISLVKKDTLLHRNSLLPVVRFNVGRWVSQYTLPTTCLEQNLKLANNSKLSTIKWGKNSPDDLFLTLQTGLLTPVVLVNHSLRPVIGKKVKRTSNLRQIRSKPAQASRWIRNEIFSKVIFDEETLKNVPPSIGYTTTVAPGHPR